MKHKKIYTILVVAIIALTLSYPVIAKDKSDGSVDDSVNVEDTAIDQTQAVASVANDGGMIPEDKVAGAPTGPVNLPFFKSYTSANYVADGVGLRNTGRGTISLRVPSGAAFIDAWIYWKVLNSVVSPYDKKIMVNGISATGTLIGSGISPCWSGTGYTYRANIKSILQQTDTTGGDFGITVGGVNTAITDGRSPWEAFSLPAAEDAEIVIVYSGTGTVSIYNGYYEQSGGIATFSIPPGTIKYTSSIGDGQIFGITPYTKSVTYSAGIAPTLLQKVTLNGVDPSITSKATHQGSLSDTDTFVLPFAAPPGASLTWNLANDCFAYDALIFSSTV